MKGLPTKNAPSLAVVKPHFIFGALALFALAVLTVLADTNLLGAYFSNKMLAITHLAVLGWGSMIVFGALYQLIPVVFDTSLYSEKLALITFWMFAVSIVFMVYSFWTAAFTTSLTHASVLMFISLLLFIINILATKKHGKTNIQSKFITGAVYWLFLTELLGLLIAFNFKYNFFTEIHLHYLKVHAHLGLIGWFLLLIIGVSSTLIPMFFVSHQANEKKLNYTFYLINAGLFLLAFDGLFINSGFLIYLNWLLITLGIAFYLSFIAESYKKRLKKDLDVGMKYTVIAVLLMVVPLFLSLLILINFNFESSLLMRITTLYGFSIIFGLITTIILGQTYKTLPFIIWLDKYKKYIGKYIIPLPRELYSEKIGKLQLYFYLIAIAAFTIGLLLNQMIAISIGSYAFLVVAVLYNINVFKIIFHKTKIEKL
ncbi:MAG: hypothetical protein GWP19_14095 [Planctomycetia bacterium]|nr:hypothetical protein [Planctomycetia bacterium]